MTGAEGNSPGISLADLGWDAFFERAMREFPERNLEPGRVVGAERTSYRVHTAGGLLAATVAGLFHREAAAGSGFPMVGDWVAARVRPADRPGEAVIRHVLRRKTTFSRLSSTGHGRARSAGGERSAAGEQQLLAANIDFVFVVTALDGDFSARRVERYVAAVRGGGALPVLVLNKADLHGEVGAVLAEVEVAAPGVPVHITSALDDEGVGPLRAYLGRGKTVAMIGSSGVGKSSLVNRLLGAEAAATGAVRAGDGRGRHTTTWRELFVLEGGGVLIDNPGIREIAVWEESPGGAFPDIDELASHCRYTDCGHTQEPGCAVLEALRSGALDPARWRQYQRLSR